MNPYAAYKKQSVTTATPMEIVVKLYGEIERQLNRAIVYIESKDYENANHALSKAQDVVDALRSVLDINLPIGQNLDSLYEYFGRQIILANAKKDVDMIKELLPMVGELKDAFSQVSAMSKDEIAAQSLRH